MPLNASMINTPKANAVSYGSMGPYAWLNPHKTNIYTKVTAVPGMASKASKHAMPCPTPL